MNQRSVHGVLSSNDKQSQSILKVAIVAGYILCNVATLESASYDYEDSDAQVMVPFGSVAAEKWQRENWKLAAMVHGNSRHAGI